MGTKDFDTSKQFIGLKINEDADINVLLLGETGAEKSTFTNAIANYLHFKDFKKAEKEDLLILIPTTITVRDVNSEQKIIKIGSSDTNKYQKVGVSATQELKTYVLPIGEGKTRLRLIDSPGMGDTRGIKQDDINCENILSYIGQLKALHAICFLMKPTNPRITVLFEYCVKQILSRLEKSASKNLVFIFTNTRSSNYGPGDTLPSFQKMLEEIRTRSPSIDIQFTTNVFCLDNEPFRFLAAIKSDVKLDESQRKYFIDSWKISSKECCRLISYIVGDVSHDPLTPHQIRNSICVNEARRLILQLSQPLTEISQIIFDNIRILKGHEQDLSVGNQSMDDLKKKLYVPVVNLEIIKLIQPVTICTAAKCSDIYQVGTVSKWHYRQRCHDPCYLNNITKEFIGDPGLVHCAAMNSKTCIKCGCDFSAHMHVYYLTKTVDDKIIDDVVQANINDKRKAVQEAKRMITQIERRRGEYEEEREKIIKITAKFAHFLQNNAITPYNDSYKKYINYLIERELGLGPYADKVQINDLTQLLKQYEEEKAALDKSLELGKQCSTNTDAVIKPKDIMKCIETLYTLKHNGKKIRELIKTQKTSRENEYGQTCSEYTHPKAAAAKPNEKEDENNDSKNKNKGEVAVKSIKQKADRKNNDKNKGEKKNSGKNAQNSKPSQQEKSSKSSQKCSDRPPAYHEIHHSRVSHPNSAPQNYNNSRNYQPPYNTNNKPATNVKYKNDKEIKVQVEINSNDLNSGRYNDQQRVYYEPSHGHSNHPQYAGYYAPPHDVYNRPPGCGYYGPPHGSYSLPPIDDYSSRPPPNVGYGRPLPNGAYGLPPPTDDYGRLPPNDAYNCLPNNTYYRPITPCDHGCQHEDDHSQIRDGRDSVSDNGNSGGGKSQKNRKRFKAKANKKKSEKKSDKSKSEKKNGESESDTSDSN